MALMRLAAVAFGLVVAAVVASPVTAQESRASAGMSMSAMSAITGAASSIMNAPRPMMGASPMDLVAGLISQATSMTGRNDTHDEGDEDATCGSVSVRDEFFSVPEAFPNVDGEELTEGVGSYLEALPRLVIVAALSPLADLADEGVFDPWLVAARRGLFDQVWFSVNVALGMGEELINMGVEVLEFIGELVHSANWAFLAFRQGAFDELLATTKSRDLINMLMSDGGLASAARMASTHDQKPLEAVVSRMGEARARLVAKVGRGPRATVRQLAAKYRELSAGGVAGMKARSRARANKPYTPRIRSFTHL